MLMEVIAAVVDMNNFVVLVVMYSRRSRSGRMCFRVINPQNHLSPAQKEKKKCIVEAAWVHSMKAYVA